MERQGTAMHPVGWRHLLPPHRSIALEYFSDVEILAGANALIGSSSNMYTLATGLRVARASYTPPSQQIRTNQQLLYSPTTRAF